MAPRVRFGREDKAVPGMFRKPAPAFSLLKLRVAGRKMQGKDLKPTTYFFTQLTRCGQNARFQAVFPLITA
jgi:hypothetical protein